MDEEGNKIKYEIFEKWGDAALAGFQSIPDVLFKNQAKLGLNAIDVVVLANILMHWWYQDNRPFPRTNTIANRMGVNIRTIQRSIKNLEQKGLLKRDIEPKNDKPLRLETHKVFDLSGLVAKLSDFARNEPYFGSRKKTFEKIFSQEK